MLVLADGTRFQGESFGYEHSATGEVVFNTAMAGYPESLTDPSYAGQIVAFTYPLIGNYGVPSLGEILNNHADTYLCDETMYADKIYAAGLIVGQYSEEHSHWNAVESLQDWLIRQKVPAITGIDTRALTKHLREYGVMSGTIVFEDQQLTSAQEKAKQFVYEKNVIPTPSSYWSDYKHDHSNSDNDPRYTILVVDFGATLSILDSFLFRGANLIRVPWDFDFNTIAFDGIVLTSGPGDPRLYTRALSHLQAFITEDEKRPLLGIGLGHQLLCQVAGATIYKLPYGHRGHNQPVRMVGTEKCFITHQNHGYAVDTATLQDDWVPSFINLNDNTNEGIRHIHKPWFSIQFTPDMNLSGEGTAFLIEDFCANLRK